MNEIQYQLRVVLVSLFIILAYIKLRYNNFYEKITLKKYLVYQNLKH